MKMFDGTKEMEAEIFAERKVLTKRFEKHILRLRRQMEVCRAIGHRLEDNSRRWCGKTDDENFRMNQSLSRAEDMLTDLREYHY
jgi:hypothetical protein